MTTDEKVMMTVGALVGLAVFCMLIYSDKAVQVLMLALP